MKRVWIIIGSLLALLALTFAFLYFARPFVEPKLHFETIAKMGDPQYGFGLELTPTIYPEGKPALFIIARPEEVDFSPKVFTRHPALADQLRQLDYDQYFVVLVLKGERTPGSQVSIQRITRREYRVNVWAEFVELSWEAELPLPTHPFHLVAVAKNGSWGEQIYFDLMKGYKRVADTSQFIPS